MKTRVNLDELMKGDLEYRTDYWREREANKRFLCLFSGMKYRRLFGFTNTVSNAMKKEDVEKILIENNLVSKESVTEAFNELIGENLRIDKSPFFQYYSLIEFSNEDNEKIYQFQGGESAIC